MHERTKNGHVVCYIRPSHGGQVQQRSNELHIRQSRCLISIYIATSTSQGLEGERIARHGMPNHASGTGWREPLQ